MSRVAIIIDVLIFKLIKHFAKLPDCVYSFFPCFRMTVVLDPGLIKISKKNFEEMSRKLSTKTLVSFRDSDHMQFFVQTAEAKMLAVR